MHVSKASSASAGTAAANSRPAIRTTRLIKRRLIERLGWRSASSRYPDDRPQAAHRTVVEGDVAAMAARNVAGDRQAEAGAAFVLVARRVQPEEGAEHVLALLGRDAGAVVIDDHGQPPAR